ncbi:TIGR04283 family arsenosugar biosynthesis glycosyltransferase [Luteolibacter sp. AS25]|uniref:TIGR04283 family arsenosugar biosynthesis glycosyltransferase n=1 Tax=Luteolibacter sp. AS25 TaxID=3135776 RepID=UPI00398A7567
MTRLPRVGKNKTRLIPALGPEGAMRFHDRLARHSIGRASAFCLSEKERHLTIAIEGGTPIEAKEWLGDDQLDCQEQAPGDLGTKMQTAAENAFLQGASKVLIIGTDCPSIDEFTLLEAERLLDNNTLVYGPALDGGYYLLGMRKIIPVVFQKISWGEGEVLNQSLAAARKVGVEPALLSPLSDVDHPEDLPMADEALSEGSSLSVIIPALNEAQNIERLLKLLKSGSPHEIIVSVGDSNDATAEIAIRNGAKVVTSPAGRGIQMNAGAKAATGDLLLFLHADTFPPAEFPSIIARELQRPNTSAGAFRFQLKNDFGPAPLIEALVSIRCRYLNRPYGDQGIFIRHCLFEKIGGFPETPIMEDSVFIRKLAKIGSIRITQEAAITSSRRWERGGIVRTFLRHQAIILASSLRLPPPLVARLRP